VFMDASMEMRIAREEIFGPVLTVIPYDEVSEAVRLANQSEYGLDGAIFGPPDEALMVARRLQCGNVHINGAVYDVSMPFGGYKQSGIGREGGREGFEGFLETKSIFL
ncbi:aldehyde dehydrogenase family protein, partial [uncultured Eubacterium sp.]|uniref:aldehyde dehydrogenase family protein n=1 Tax=uncultured Eubacterium sp. TaxID=165185 RepID=UPI002596563F